MSKNSIMEIARMAKPLPSTFITKDIVNARVKNYQEHKHHLLSTDLGRDDSKAGWYSLRQLEELMRELYYQNADGLRIYFGAYDNADLKYPGQLTVLFVPTRKDKTTGLHQDIIIDDEMDFEYRSSLAEDEVEKSLDSIALCPPSCDQQDLAYPFADQL